MRIQMVQDITCPWCRIGKHNLDAAIGGWEERHNDTVAVEFVPFLLDPMERGTRESFQERLRERKNMTQEQIEEMFNRASEAGKNVGLTFNWDRIETAADTIYAHQMMALSPREAQSRLLDALHTAYFEEGKDIGDTSVLAEIGKDAGLSPDDLESISAAWASPELRAELLSVVQQVQQAGISGVPFFIVDSKLGISGAQPSDVLAEAMDEARVTPAAD